MLNRTNRSLARHSRIIRGIRSIIGNNVLHANLNLGDSLKVLECYVENQRCLLPVVLEGAQSFPYLILAAVLLPSFRSSEMVMFVVVMLELTYWDLRHRFDLFLEEMGIEWVSPSQKNNCLSDERTGAKCQHSNLVLHR